MKNFTTEINSWDKSTRSKTVEKISGRIRLMISLIHKQSAKDCSSQMPVLTYSWAIEKISRICGNL